jgi:DNA polymerase alpha-associated DNA helicase A
VVLATLHGAGSKQLWGEKFDIVVIDEGSQALEAQCWIPLLLTNKTGISKLILAGDPLQLPPTIKSQTKISKPPPSAPTSATAIPKSLETTLFSRLLTLHGDSIKRILTTQYRMHTSIMSFPSQELYDNLLTASPSISSRLLSTSLPYPVAETEETSIPLLFIDTQGGSFPEDPAPKTTAKLSVTSESKSNTLEARVVAQHVHNLVSAGVQPSNIGVLTPYNAQVSLITKMLRRTYPAVEVNSVDSFQGREKEAVVFSLVRSNDDREVGFLKDVRRINVAITRARCHLCVVGDGETVGSEGKKSFLGRWVEWLESEGSGCEVRYPDVGDVLAGWAGQIVFDEDK